MLVKDRYRRIWAYNQQGELLWHVQDPGGYRTAHQPRPMDIDGDGYDEILVGGSKGIYRADGTCIATLATPDLPETGEPYEASVLKADMTGNGVPDILYITPTKVYIYRNEHGRRPEGGFPLGTGANVTLY